MRKTDFSHPIACSKRRHAHARILRDIDRDTYREISFAARHSLRADALWGLIYARQHVAHLPFPERRRRRQAALILAGIHLATARRARRGAL